MKTVSQSSRYSENSHSEPLMRLSRNIILMENHNEALTIWQEAKVKEKILIHIDAHLDFCWIAEKNPLELLNAKSIKEVDNLLKVNYFWNPCLKDCKDSIDIGNYIYPAVKDGIVKKIYWVIPDVLWNNPYQMKKIKSGFAAIKQLDPKGYGTLNRNGVYLTAEIYGAKLICCRLSDLPNFKEDILLDIDVDFFIANPILDEYHPRWVKDRHPWIWPIDFVEVLSEKGIRSNLATIAYSVEGGFTPLQYKYLGSELAALLSGISITDIFKKSMNHKRQGSDFRRREMFNEAIEEFKQALEIDKNDAACYYNLSLLYCDIEDYRKAKEAYSKTVEIDSSYETPFNNYGPVYERIKAWDLAGDEYAKILRLIPEDTKAHCGLGNVFREKGQWERAIVEYGKSIALDPLAEKAHFGLAKIYQAQGDLDRSQEQYTITVNLAPDNPRAYYELAGIYMKKKNWDNALDSTKAHIRLGRDGIITRLRLSIIYWHKRQFSSAIKELKRAVRFLVRGRISRKIQELDKNKKTQGVCYVR